MFSSETRFLGKISKKSLFNKNIFKTFEAIYCLVAYADIDECASVPCQNSGTCVDDVNSYMCECDRNYNGTHCESGM